MFSGLGSLKLKSRIGFGCMSLDANDGSSQEVLEQAFSLGINFFDTADLYQQGANEALLGKVFRNRRSQVLIATKVGNQWNPDGKGWHWNPGRRYILDAVEQSLRRLQTDYIDLYQLHGGTIEDPIEETITAFEQLKQQGKIREYGISSIRPNVIRAWVSRSSLVSVMMQYGLLDRRPEENIFGLLEQRNIGVLARGVLAKGMLSSKPPAEFLNYTAAQVRVMANQVAVLSDLQRTAAQTAIQFVLSNQAIAVAVIGIRTPEQLREAVAAEQARPLSKQEIEILRGALPVNQYVDHR
ncbi:MAG TPA: aldo/keto reductase [Puia sp.]|nr:aldo/keto reductase [Puia sp.]